MNEAQSRKLGLSTLCVFLILLNAFPIFSSHALGSTDQENLITGSGSANGDFSEPSPEEIRYSAALHLLSYGQRLGFENSDIRTGWEWGTTEYEIDPPTPPRLESNTINPHIEGERSLKVTVLPDDLKNNGARAEVSTEGNAYFVDGDNIFYHWYTYFPEDLEIPVTKKVIDPTTGREQYRINAWHIWTQWLDSMAPTCWKQRM